MRVRYTQLKQGVNESGNENSSLVNRKRNSFLDTRAAKMMLFAAIP